MASERALFLSYSREDADAARRIADALRSYGIEVWFDQNDLHGGDTWDAKIRQQIRTCTLCVPIISATTQARHEGYFRREWKLAAERTHDMASGVAFLLPVVIDDTPENEALVPEEFMRIQWTRLPQGVATPGFIEQVRRLMAGGGRSLQGTAAPRPRFSLPATPSAAPAAKRGKAGWTFGAVIAVVVGIATAVWVARKPAAAPEAVPPSSPAAAKPATIKLEPRTDKSVAVLPFANMSEDKDANAFFADGMHEDLLTNLALVKELRVVSRTSVMGYRGTTKSMKEIAQELGVTYILEGSVRRVGNKVRVTGQLIHAATDEHVWAQSYDRELTDVFSIQAELSQQIAQAMKAALSPEEKILIARKPTENAEAYDLFLRARDLSNREGNTMGMYTRKIELLRQAVALDPRFGQAWAELAASCAYWGFSAWDGMDAKLAEAKPAMDRALQLAPDDPEVIASLGTYYYYSARDYTRAAEQYRRLAQLQPNSPVTANSLGLILRRQGKWAESLIHTRRAGELDPSNIVYQRNLLATLRAARRWDEAIATQRRIVALLPDDLQEKLELAALEFSKNGSKQAAEAFFAGLSESVRNSPSGIALRRGWAQISGDYAEDVRLDRLQPYYDEDGMPRWHQAFFSAYSYYATGDTEGARKRLGDFPAEIRDKVKQEEINNARVWGFLGAMEAMLGNKEAALRCGERATELLPESRDALDGVTVSSFRAAFIYEMVGEREKLLSEYRRLFRIPIPMILNVHELKAGMPRTQKDAELQAIFDDPANNAPLF